MEETFAERANENTGRQRNNAGPLPRTLYDLFLNCLRARSATTLPEWKCCWPSGPELKAAGFPKPRGGITRRERFKSWAERMDIRFDAEANCYVLVYKRTGKIIIPVEEFQTVVRKVHSIGHYDARKTFSMIQEKYTVGHRDFGIDKSIISVVVETCPSCLMKGNLANGLRNGDNHQLEHNRLPAVTYNGKFLSDAKSMVANAPDNKCIWFDKSVLTDNQDFNSKLQGLINELRGELGAVLRGSRDARDRLLNKISITQFVVNEQKNSAQQSTEIPEYNQKFIDDMKSLLESYRIQGREKLFHADMELLAGAYKTAGYTDLFLQSVEALIRSLLSR